jgi:hypothetical protein
MPREEERKAKTKRAVFFVLVIAIPQGQSKGHEKG